MVLNLEGFEQSAAAIRRMTPAQWVAAAGEHGGRGPRHALADPAVHDDIKAALRMMGVVSARIPGTPAERERQCRELTWQGGDVPMIPPPSPGAFKRPPFGR